MPYCHYESLMIIASLAAHAWQPFLNFPPLLQYAPTSLGSKILTLCFHSQVHVIVEQPGAPPEKS